MASHVEMNSPRVYVEEGEPLAFFGVTVAAIVPAGSQSWGQITARPSRVPSRIRA
jgi:hypothetical protein